MDIVLFHSNWSLKEGLMKYIDDTLTELEKSFGKPRGPVDVERLRRRYAEKGLAPLVGMVAAHMLKECVPRISVGVYRCGAPVENPAWIYPPKHLPMYGTEDFKQALFQIGYQAEFVKRAKFETLIFGTAHEIAHVLLDSVHHPLAKDEKVVDLTAMHCGFAEVYSEGKKYIHRVDKSRTMRYTGVKGLVADALGLNGEVTNTTTHIKQVGYLSEAEVWHACSVLNYTRAA